MVDIDIWWVGERVRAKGLGEWRGLGVLGVPIFEDLGDDCDSAMLHHCSGETKRWWAESWLLLLGTSIWGREHGGRDAVAAVR